MTDKEAIDRLNGVNLSLKQKQAIIDVIKNINNNDSNKEEDIPLIGVINKDVKESNDGAFTHKCIITPTDDTFIPVIGKLYKVKGIKQAYIIFYFSNKDVDEGYQYFDSNIIVLDEGQGTIFNMDNKPYLVSIHYSVNKNNIVTGITARLKYI